MNPRLTAAKCLINTICNKKSLNQTLPNDAPALTKGICFGVCRWFFQLNTIANHLLKKPFKSEDIDIHILLLIGLYQLLHMRTPNHAAIHETVELAKKLKKSWATNLLNACLRRFLTEQETLLSITNKEETCQYAHPKWLIKKLKSAWPGKWQEILTANNTQAPMTLRVNLNTTTIHDYLKQLDGAHIVNENIDTAIQLAEPIQVTQLPKFSQGFVSIQDAVSQCVAPLFKLSPGMKVLDACSAPGGKACHLLEKFPGIELTALDISEQRLQKINENFERLSLNARLLIGDATKLANWWDDQLFDAILLDAPCSATGVIRRHPDIKLLRKKGDIAKLASQQLLILKTLWQTLKTNGTLIYTTCSILPEENDEVIKQFLQEESSASLIDFSQPIGEKTNYGWQCFPEINGHDGFYYSALNKDNITIDMP